MLKNLRLSSDPVRSYHPSGTVDTPHGRHYFVLFRLPLIVPDYRVNRARARSELYVGPDRYHNQEQPGRSYLPEPMQEVDERAYPPAREPTQSVPTGYRQDGHLSSATKLHLTLHWTRGAPPFRDRRRPTIGLSLQSSPRSLQVGKCTA